MKSDATLRNESLLPYELAVKLFDYNPGTGVLCWKKRHPKTRYDKMFNTSHAGDQVGSPHSAGYLQFKYNGARYFVHRVAWLASKGEWPALDIDHKNQIKTDNRVANLREVSKIENKRNCSLHSSNTSGINGVDWQKARGKWRACVMIEGKTKNLGLFCSKSDAAKARSDADALYGFSSIHGIDKTKLLEDSVTIDEQTTREAREA
jgi:hypothetical protein